ncbi:MAG TPA: RNA 2'-phosphotransferase [Candidatus Acidoferrales bacterium]|nr:RNA 2'-phosphotransferase [Candidatus Acidoferrales bacterium]
MVAPERISRFLSFLLRHNPPEYRLRFDRRGFVSWDELFAKVRERFGEVSEAEVLAVIEGAEKKRFEFAEGKVRATYGHSFPVELELQSVEPPERLYHGTARDLARNFLRAGLTPRDRRHVYLSESLEEAIAVGKRRDPLPAVLVVAARAAHADGIRFYHSGNLFLVEAVPARFLSLWDSGAGSARSA